MKLIINTDGLSKGNPGAAAIGAVLKNEKGKTVATISHYIGVTTNNVAEYTALLYGLEEALMLKAENIQVNTDSQLLYRQIKKEYKVKSPNIIGLYSLIKEGSKWSPLRGEFERNYQFCIGNNVAAGTSEIQRNIIAWTALGLPRK